MPPIELSPTGAGAIQDYVNDIELALSCSAVYAALALALALPDICAAMHLSTDAERTTRARYVRWCLEYVSLVKPEPGSAPSKNIRRLKAEHIYALRCAYLHNGTTKMTKRHDGVRGILGGIQLVWEGPEPRPSMVFTIGAADAEETRSLQIQMNAAMLCRGIAQGVERWLVAVQGNDVVQRNLSGLLAIEKRPAITRKV